MEKEEGPAFGAAILASVGCGEYKDVCEASNKIAKLNKIYKPNGELVKKYEIAYKRFKEIYPTMKLWFKN